MILTAKQEEGLKIAVHKYHTREPYVCIAGWAGVGKSTLVKFIIEALRVPEERVCYIAYTGKAAQVLRQKGCPNAMTAHRLLYKSIPLGDGRFKHIPYSDIEPYQVIVVDEVSMLPKKMWELLLKHKKYVIALGDPGQLPPVAADNVDILDHPDIFLDEIMRQALENEIIRFSLDVREGRSIKLYNGQDVRVVPRSEYFQPGFLLWGDEILCAKNITRKQINSDIRNILFPNQDLKEPLVGDKIICLKNDWFFVNETGDALVNGLCGEIVNAKEIKGTKSNPYMDKTLHIDLNPDFDGAYFYDVELDYRLIVDGEPTVTWENWKRIPRIYHPKEFDYGYAITVWKAQGSEWDKVIGFCEHIKDQTREDYKKYLYTMITRASKKLILVRED